MSLILVTNCLLCAIQQVVLDDETLGSHRARTHIFRVLRQDNASHTRQCIPVYRRRLGHASRYSRNRAFLLRDPRQVALRKRLTYRLSIQLVRAKVTNTDPAFRWVQAIVDILAVGLGMPL